MHENTSDADTQALCLITRKTQNGQQTMRCGCTPDGFTAGDSLVDRLGGAHHLALADPGFAAVRSNLIGEQVGQLLHSLCKQHVPNNQPQMTFSD